jgi:uncharacterized membrane protein (DUF4010 family)
MRLAIAALVGAGVGLEREWTVQSSGQDVRFAGLRTFMVLGLLGGIAGLLISEAAALAGSMLLLGGMGLTVAAYVMAARRPDHDIGGTTEAAALVVIALGALAGAGFMMLAAATGSLVVLALSEKKRLHWLVGRVGRPELQATLQFAVLAFVVLPILPEGPFGGALALRPRAVWGFVLLFSGLNFLAYILQKAVGPGLGEIVTGATGGVVSSTLVTLNFSRRSRGEHKHAEALAFGVIAACTVLVPRVVIVSTFIAPAMMLPMAKLLWPCLLVGLAATYIGWRRQKPNGEEQLAQEIRNPLRLRSAIEMALVFQVAMIVIAYARDRWGTAGIYTTAAALGLTDVDALTMTMARLDGGLSIDMAARAIAIGIISNTVLKLVMGVSLGAPAFRKVLAPGLLLLGAAVTLTLVVG